MTERTGVTQWEDDAEPAYDTDRAWLCRWSGGELIVWARTIQDARLQARANGAGPNAPVTARLATRLEQGEPA